MKAMRATLEATGLGSGYLDTIRRATRLAGVVDGSLALSALGDPRAFASTEKFTGIAQLDQVARAVRAVGKLYEDEEHLLRKLVEMLAEVQEGDEAPPTTAEAVGVSVEPAVFGPGFFHFRFIEILPILLTLVIAWSNSKDTERLTTSVERLIDSLQQGDDENAYRACWEVNAVIVERSGYAASRSPVKLRPKGSSPTVFTLTPGQPMLVLTKKGKWSCVQVPRGGELHPVVGWVRTGAVWAPHRAKRR